MIMSAAEIEEDAQSRAELYAKESDPFGIASGDEESPPGSGPRGPPLLDHVLLKGGRPETPRSGSTESSSILSFRILLAGKSLNGKSTLCHKVLRVGQTTSESLFGDRTPVGHIWTEQTFPDENRHLILHDSGGFESGKDETIKTLSNFIRYRATLGFAGQIHSIWYCIGCDQPLQETDKMFLGGDFHTGSTPIFIIFTKYDCLLDRVRRRERSRELTEAIEKKAYEEFEKEFSQPVYRLVKDVTKVTVCRTAISDIDDQELLPQDLHYKDPQIDFFGTKNLIRRVAYNLHRGDLKTLWMQAQQGDPEAKLSSTSASPWPLAYLRKRLTRS
jgi:GTPase SAR1 family protein